MSKPMVELAPVLKQHAQEQSVQWLCIMTYLDCTENLTKYHHELAQILLNRQISGLIFHMDNKPIKCPACGGTGKDNVPYGERCDDCGGAGELPGSL